MPRVLSGIQPTGNLHLGNYLGAIANWAAMQDAYECLFCVVDLHAITMFQDPAALRSGTRDMTAALLASGIDPAKSVLFAQSAVPQHAELGWVLGCTARMGWLNRMTQFKDKAGKDKEGSSLGLFAYPVLQAADILIYKATHVPVGDDQKQHLELARDIATKFNGDYSVDLFPLPEPVIGLDGGATRIMSLRDGTAKMSKSDPSPMSRIDLTDNAETILSKLRKAKSDADALPSEIAGLADRPEARNLVGIYAALAGITPDAVLAEYGGQGFGRFKPALAELTVARLAPITARYRTLRADEAKLDQVLRDGAITARAVAAPVLAEVYETIGFLSR